MLTLHGFGSGFGIVDPSPFVLKVDAYLRLAGIAFELNTDSSNFSKAPKGKLPFIEENGEIVADSQLIIAKLSEQYSVTLDDWLSPEQKAQAHLLSKSLDEDLYWYLVYSRWIDDNIWPKVKAEFFDKMPFPLKIIVPIVARKGVKTAMNKQGLSRHSVSEIAAMAKRSFDSWAQLLSATVR
ncbi:MAG: glutathione S-transferase [Alteromonadaceae bacterium]|nr:MAG: glutathione S-transferase [Alteromonadaceae bacterium]